MEQRINYRKVAPEGIGKLSGPVAYVASRALEPRMPAPAAPRKGATV